MHTQTQSPRHITKRIWQNDSGSAKRYDEDKCFAGGVENIHLVTAAHQMIPVAVESSQHHVCGVQRVDEVGWEGVFLFDRVWPPATRQKTENTYN